MGISPSLSHPNIDLHQALNYGQDAGVAQAKPREEPEKLDNSEFTESLHSPEESKPQAPENNTLPTDHYLRQGVNASNLISTGISASFPIINLLTKNKTVLEFFKKLAQFSAKAGLAINAGYNVYDHHKKNEIAGVIGYAWELIVSLFMPFKITGLLRGISFPIYQLPNIARSVAAAGASTSYAENIKMLKDSLIPGFKQLFRKDTYKLDNTEKLLGIWGGVLSLAGVGSWLLTQSTKLGGWIKGIGELLIDLYQVSSEQRDRRKLNYIRSGWSFVAGSICEIISKQLKDEPITGILYLCGSGIGRYFMTKSNQLGEASYPIGGPAESSQKQFAMAG